MRGANQDSELKSKGVLVDLGGSHGGWRVFLALGLLVALFLAPSGRESIESRGRLEPIFDRVVLVSVDGLRPDAIDPAGARHLATLRDTGLQALIARTVYPSSTLPGHTSMLTGVVPEKHGIRLNSLRAAQAIAFPTVFEILKRHHLRSVVVSGKPKLSIFDEAGGVDEYFGPTPAEPAFFYAERIGEVLEGIFSHELPELLFVHFPDPDAVGHKTGWMSEEQFAAIRRVDAVIGQITEQMLRRLGEGERILLIVTADHGGKGLGHRNDAEEDLRIPWFAWSPPFIQPGTIHRIVRTTDTTPTILDVLGLPHPHEIQGRAVAALSIPARRLREQKHLQDDDDDTPR